MKPNHSRGENQLPVAERIAYLIAGILQNSLTEAEHDELDAWIVESEENTRLFEELTDENNIQAFLDWHRQLDQEKALNKIKEELGLKRAVRPLFRSFLPYAVAVAGLVVLAVSAYLLVGNRHTKPNSSIAKAKDATLIHPGRDQAVLTLASGRTIILDSTGRGVLASEGNVSIKKGEQGELIYEGKDQEMKYNMVSTPRGGQYKLVLGDGTRIWLNAESSLKFPAGFAPNQRDVELKGEAYFEVAKNPFSPFKVKILTPNGNGGIVEVLGTHFNINSYGDEPIVKTTLLEGSVRVTKEGQSVVLQPGQQAQTGADIKVVSVATEDEVAWKEGEFVFRNATIQSIAAQLTRWYDIEVEYKGSITDHFNATIERKEPLESLLHYLEGTKRVHFTLEGKKLVIGP